MKIIIGLLLAFFTSGLIAQTGACADILADTGKYASPKNFYTQKSSNEGISWIKQFDNKTGEASYLIILRAYNPEFYPAQQKGLNITFKNEKTISHPELQAQGIKCTNQRGCVYEITLLLNEEELKLFRSSEINSYKIGAFTGKVSDGKKYKDQLNCLERKKVK